ncbi:hypothetical protein EYF80_023263 [Liparis tanakae]|uniref:Uncharacterized protein n=1 Tax=Liparis tanakae TaxID=230148 RepID=A0A4Z2HLF5_9TELE|nr:hypothetical protein EYF80_023263 [Liparis tanakae]
MDPKAEAMKVSHTNTNAAIYYGFSIVENSRIQSIQELKFLFEKDRWRPDALRAGTTRCDKRLLVFR